MNALSTQFQNSFPGVAKQGMTGHYLAAEGSPTRITVIAPGAGIGADPFLGVYQNDLRDPREAIIGYDPGSTHTFGLRGFRKELVGLLREVRKVHPDTPLALHTISGSSSYILEAERLGELEKYGIRPEEILFESGIFTNGWDRYSSAQLKQVRTNTPKIAMTHPAGQTTHFFPENGIMGLINRLSYQFGIENFWNDREFYFSKEFREQEGVDGLQNLLRSLPLNMAGVLSLALFYYLTRFDFSPALKTLSSSGTRFLFVTGDEDGSVHSQQSVKAFSAIPEVERQRHRLVPLTGIGHMPSMERPLKVAQLLARP